MQTINEAGPNSTFPVLHNHVVTQEHTLRGSTFPHDDKNSWENNVKEERDTWLTVWLHVSGVYDMFITAEGHGIGKATQLWRPAERDRDGYEESKTKTIPMAYFFQLSSPSLSHLPTMPSNHPMSLSVGWSIDEVRTFQIQSLLKWEPAFNLWEHNSYPNHGTHKTQGIPQEVNRPWGWNWSPA